MKFTLIQLLLGFFFNVLWEENIMDIIILKQNTLNYIPDWYETEKKEITVWYLIT